MTNMYQEIDKFLSGFIDGAVSPYFTSEKMVQKTRVKKICTDNFQKEVLNNNSFTECILEVFKHDCPSCNYNGKVFNIFSRKLEKYDLLNKLPCFRMAIDNKNPFVGTFFYSPMYFYIKKDREGHIIELSILDPPHKYDEFVKGIKDRSDTLRTQLDSIKIKPRQQVMMFYNQSDLKKDFDIDFDLAEEPPVEEQKSAS